MKLPAFYDVRKVDKAIGRAVRQHNENGLQLTTSEVWDEISEISFRVIWGALYGQQGQHKKYTLCCLALKNGTEFVGIAELNPPDKWDTTVGENIALSKAMKQYLEPL